MKKPLGSAESKIREATKRIAEISKILGENRPFRFVIETNTTTRERAARTKQNEAVIEEVATIAGGIIHDLRSAIDHTFFQIVSPFATSEAERKRIQFPTCETANRLAEAAQNRLADRPGQRFLDAIIGLKPYKETGGNKLLYLLHDSNVVDKHRGLIPLADYSRLTSDILRQHDPYFPANVEINITSSQSYYIASWPLGSVSAADLGDIILPTTDKFEKEINVPVGVLFGVGEGSFERPFIPTLNKLVDVARATIAIMINNR